MTPKPRDYRCHNFKILNPSKTPSKPSNPLKHSNPQPSKPSKTLKNPQKHSLTYLYGVVTWFRCVLYSSPLPSFNIIEYN